MAEEPLIQVEHVSKRFCRDLKRSLWYGVKDIAAELFDLFLYIRMGYGSLAADHDIEGARDGGGSRDSAFEFYRFAGETSQGLGPEPGACPQPEAGGLMGEHSGDDEADGSDLEGLWDLG